MTDPILHGKDILLLEDETFINMAVCEELQDAGCQVRAFFTIEEAGESLDRRLPDGAVLDINIAGRESYEIADRLEHSGVPFVFFTSYARSALPKQWQAHAVCEKAHSAGVLQQLLAAALSET